MSGGSSGPSSQTVTNTNIPDYARPYVEDVLGRTQALTDTNQNPYQVYGGQRIAGQTGLQQQAANTAGGMTPAGQLGQATGIASNVANNAQGAGQYSAGQFSPGQRPGNVGTGQGAMMTGTGQWNGQAAQSYMNPYMQQVVDVQNREAARQSQMQGQTDGASAVANGAYGGTRDALVDSERERNLGILQNNNQINGANAAWQQAQTQFNTDQGRQLQSGMANQGAQLTAQGQRLQGQVANQNAGLTYNSQGLQAQQLGEQSRQYGSQAGLAALNTQLNASNALQSIGQQQYGQQIGIAGLQNQLGQQQQATQQAGLDTSYQDFVNRQMYPYRQLEFENNIVHGNYSPNTTTSVYGGYGSPASQLAGIGTAAYGMSKMAKGGRVGYAEGGLASLPPEDRTFEDTANDRAKGPPMAGPGRTAWFDRHDPGAAARDEEDARRNTPYVQDNPYGPKFLGLRNVKRSALPKPGQNTYDGPRKDDYKGNRYAAGGQIPGLAGLLISQIA